MQFSIGQTDRDRLRDRQTDKQTDVPSSWKLVLILLSVISFNMADECAVGKLLETVNFAAVKHKNQRRKDPEKTPYINHPIGVAYILWKEGGINNSIVLQVQHFEMFA